jgi:hypothetical protein
VFSHAQESGQLPAVADADILGDMLSSLVLGAINAWICDVESDLAAALRFRAAVLLAGIREVTAPGIASPAT